MSAQTHSVEDISTMSADELGELESEDLPNSIDADELTFPSFQHHMRVRQKLEILGENGLLTESEIEEVYDSWLEGR